MCKGNYVFQPGDVVKRKDTELDGTWRSAMSKLCKEPTAPLVVKYCRASDIEVEGIPMAWGTWTFDLVRRASTQGAVFQPGDIVRRKVLQEDSGWVGTITAVEKKPYDDLVVDSCDRCNLTLVGVPEHKWTPAYFELVRRNTPSTKANTQAGTILQNAAAEMLDRAASRDTPEGERSMGRCVKAFNAMFGTELTETQGWQFMELLKMARSVGGEFRLDDFTDGVAYAALAGESESRLKQHV